ncbi:response regulator transcription factor [Termitidicoccus mucosus]|uniref:LuxR family transcriptional regulator n=1 Tax=Termitidicoccus mucosus TaxID=1184151 RepID=A0A178IMM3_9BACT|nr:LuxR family transcriptional regulator [Opitutaceae bacterium TSB47]
MSITTVGIVEDDLVLRNTLARIIDDTPGFQCVGKCASAEEALKRLPPLKPAVIIMDLNLPVMTGIECTRRMSALLPSTPIIILTMYEDGELIFRALKAGASGYLIKRSKPDEVLTAIKEAHEGGAPMSSHIARRVVFSFREPPPSADAAAATATLTEREHELLQYLSQGFANKEIADKLNISIPTVRTHLRHIYEKLHVRSRTEAVVKVMGASSSRGT